jgi:hypothetical protein
MISSRDEIFIRVDTRVVFVITCIPINSIRFRAHAYEVILVYGFMTNGLTVQ